MSQLRGIPIVQFKGVVFLPTEQDCETFGTILQMIAQKMVLLFSVCENRGPSFEEQRKALEGVNEVGQALPILLDLSKKLRGSTESSTQLQKFQEKEDRLEGSIHVIQETLRSWSPNQSREVTLSIYGKVFPELLKTLNAVSDLLRLQEENKINTILSCAQTCLGFLKQVRDQSVSKPLLDNANLWFNELHRLAMQRVNFMPDLNQARRLEAAAQNGLHRWNLLNQHPVKSTDDIAFIARCIGEICEVTQSFVDISNSFSVSSGDEVDLENFGQLLDSLIPSVQAGDLTGSMSVTCSIVRTVQRAFETGTWGSRGDVSSVQDATQRLPNVVRRCVNAFDTGKREEFNAKLQELHSIIDLLKAFDKLNGNALKSSRDFLDNAATRLQRALGNLSHMIK
eukprot:TRINITY_DN5964_c0_g1_i2.p1 TRINITY_DN5964_c0_g1~~TRINITY_DN5964_c0_g1_i2.p1  ORF type:complete len:397 (-),score=74.28 TRINITY_DN5964_c0_g1_i2:12-1202(-)